MLSNYLDKTEYATIVKSLNEEELGRFKETRGKRYLMILKIRKSQRYRRRQSPFLIL